MHQRLLSAFLITMLAPAILAPSEAQAASPKASPRSGKAATASFQPGVFYKWKDAKGRAHYTDLPPPAGVKYERRTYVAPQFALVEPEPSVSPLCEAAKVNLALLQKPGEVVMAQPNGTLMALNEEEKQQQLVLARQQQLLHCQGKAAPPPASAGGGTGAPPPANVPSAPLPPLPLPRPEPLEKNY